MDREQTEKLAFAAAIITVLAALLSGRLPRWLRMVLVAALVLLLVGAGLYGYRKFAAPVTLTVAAGSIDGDAQRYVAALGAHMAASGSRVRFKILERETPLEAIAAFSRGEADLVLARPDVGGLGDARAVVVVTQAVVLLVVPPGSPVSEIDNLRGKTVGVIGYELNKQVIDALSAEYEFDRNKVTFKGIEIKDAAAALKAKQIQALLVVMPISAKYLGILRALFPRTNGKARLQILGIEAAGAIAANNKAYESYDLPKGTVFGSPAVPDDDLTTLRVPYYLLAKRKLADDIVTSLAQTIMEERHTLIAEYPLLAQITAPSSDKDAFVPIHPGAATYFDGEQQSLLQKYGDSAFYVTVILGMLASLAAGAWKFAMRPTGAPGGEPLARLYALTPTIESAADNTALTAIEDAMDAIVKDALTSPADAGDAPTDATALGLATQRLERQIARRRAALMRKG